MINGMVVKMVEAKMVWMEMINEMAKMVNGGEMVMMKWMEAKVVKMKWMEMMMVINEMEAKVVKMKWMEVVMVINEGRKKRKG